MLTPGDLRVFGLSPLLHDSWRIFPILLTMWHSDAAPRRPQGKRQPSEGGGLGSSRREKKLARRARDSSDVSAKQRNVDASKRRVDRIDTSK